MCDSEPEVAVTVRVDVTGCEFCPPPPPEPEPPLPQPVSKGSITANTTITSGRLLKRRRKPIHPRASATEVTGANGNRVWFLLIALAGTAMVIVEELPGVTALGEKLHDAPVGSPEQANDTEPVNPSVPLTVMLAVPELPL